MRTFLLVTTSNDVGAGITTIRMGSRNKHGFRLLSNRLGQLKIDQTPPPADDEVIAHIGRELSEYKHASGFQAVGNYVAEGLEDSLNGQNAMVKIFDYGNPAFPVELTDAVLSPSQYGSSNAGTTSIARLSDGMYLLIVGARHAEELQFYKSSEPLLTKTRWLKVARWRIDEQGLASGSIDSDWSGYQNINLVSQCNGDLFLLGTTARDSRGDLFPDVVMTGSMPVASN